MDWKRVGRLLVVTGLLTACGVSTPPSVTPQPALPITAKEAYEKGRPVMLTWHEDAVVVSVKAEVGKCPPFCVYRDGRALSWSFLILSVEALRLTNMAAGADHAYHGDKEIPLSESMLRYPAFQRIPLEELIDSEEAAAIARQHGVSPNDRPMSIALIKSEMHVGEEIQCWWELSYGDDPYKSREHKKIYIDARTGKVGRNDFAK